MQGSPSQGNSCSGNHNNAIKVKQKDILSIRKIPNKFDGIIRGKWPRETTQVAVLLTGAREVFERVSAAERERGSKCLP